MHLQAGLPEQADQLPDLAGSAFCGQFSLASTPLSRRSVNLSIRFTKADNQANHVDLLGFLRRFRAKDQPLTGAPAVRRQKTYSAQSGYVYQYYFEGRRLYARAGESGVEYVFDVSADRKTSFAASILVSDDAVAQWEAQHGRTLNSTERYAIAKMALFQAFDERPDPSSMREEILARPADVQAILEALDID
jgi:hypothetical protein